MKNLDLSNYGPIISSKSIGEEIFNLISNQLKKDEQLTIDLSSIKSMATFCAKQIFGRLYIEMGSEAFFDKISIKGADEDLKTIIQIGIQNAIKERNPT